jgi:uncharacterized protein YecT (DUF1311 family)
MDDEYLGKHCHRSVDLFPAVANLKVSRCEGARHVLIVRLKFPVLRGAFGLGLMALLFVSGAAALAEPVFTPAATEACVSEAEATSPGLGGHGVLDCIGRAAGACMMTPGGDTTLGMMECLEGEQGYWDARLNVAYAGRIAAAQALDAEIRTRGSAAASVEGSLRTMQRAWISFRDASCLYEQAQWMGGTGGGPATQACHMHETARQALKLEGWWAQ